MIRPAKAIERGELMLLRFDQKAAKHAVRSKQQATTSEIQPEKDKGNLAG